MALSRRCVRYVVLKPLRYIYIYIYIYQLQHQHCTDEAQKAETVLSAVSYIYIYIYKRVDLQNCFQSAQ